jgi:hypothetical protein
VVIKRFTQHVVALPIYTHNNNGLVGKRGKNEFVSIRDVSSSNAAPAESEHPRLWCQVLPGFGDESWHRMKDTTSVHFTSPYSHKMDQLCTFSEQLLPQSLLQLKVLHANALGLEVEERSTRSDPGSKSLSGHSSNPSNTILNAPEIKPSGLTKLLPKVKIAPSSPLPSPFLQPMDNLSASEEGEILTEGDILGD